MLRATARVTAVHMAFNANSSLRLTSMMTSMMQPASTDSPYHYTIDALHPISLVLTPRITIDALHPISLVLTPRITIDALHPISLVLTPRITIDALHLSRLQWREIPPLELLARDLSVIIELSLTISIRHCFTHLTSPSLLTLSLS
jgi:hypothetical protein